MVREISNMEFDLYSMLILGLSLSIPFSLWWLYFDSVDGAPIRALREKGKIGVYSLWLFGHFPLVVAITSVGVGLGYVISKAHALALSYTEQWLICGSLHCLWALKGYYTSHLLILTCILALLRIIAPV